MAVDGAGDSGAPGTEQSNGGTQHTKNDAVGMVARGDAEGPPQLALAVTDSKYTIAATGAAAGAIISLGGLFYILSVGDLVRMAGLVAFLGAVFGACGMALVTHGRLVDIRRHLASNEREVERKARENAELRKLILRDPGTSNPGKLDPPRRSAESKKKGKEGKRR